MRILWILVLALAACHSVKPGMPAATVIEKPVKVFVPIPDALVALCDWPHKAPPSQSIDVAKKRRDCLEFYEQNIGGIKKVRGQPVPEKSP